MKFLIDANLPIGLAIWIRQRGHDVVHVADVLGVEADDSEIRRHANDESRIVISKDADFSISTADASRRPRVVWLRLGNATNKSLKRWLDPRWPEIERMLNDGERLIEVR